MKIFYKSIIGSPRTIIDPKGIVLTNRYVVTGEKEGTINIYFIGLIKSTNDEPNFGTKDNPNLAQVKFKRTKIFA